MLPLMVPWTMQGCPPINGHINGLLNSNILMAGVKLWQNIVSTWQRLHALKSGWKNRMRTPI